MVGFPRERRVHRAAEIRAIVGEGRCANGAHLRVHALFEPESTSAARVVVVVPRFGRTAVERNRLKRRLRELARLHVLEAPELIGAAVVVKARASAYESTFRELREELLEVLGRVIRERWVR
jgi:ribonuclease P protein component